MKKEKKEEGTMSLRVKLYRGFFTAIVMAVMFVAGFRGNALAVDMTSGDLVFVMFGNNTEFVQNLGPASALLSPGTTTFQIAQATLTAVGGTNPVNWALIGYNVSGPIVLYAGSSIPSSAYTPGQLASISIPLSLNVTAVWEAQSSGDGLSQKLLSAADPNSFTSNFGTSGSLAGGFPVSMQGAFGATLTIITGDYNTSAISDLGQGQVSFDGTLLSICSPVCAAATTTTTSTTSTTTTTTSSTTTTTTASTTTSTTTTSTTSTTTTTTSTTSTTINTNAILKFTRVAPNSGLPGTFVTIVGQGFTGATSVQFNGVSAPFAVYSNYVIRATVPTGATTGHISVTTPSGTGTSTFSFTLPGPVIKYFTPLHRVPNFTIPITIVGSGFSVATDVKFNGVSAPFTVFSNYVIRATIPGGATTGPISVTTPYGTATSVKSFTP